MARYRKIDVRIYADARFKSLSKPNPNAQTLWLYLLTGPHTGMVPGLSHVGEAALAESLGWPMEAFREAFGEVLAEGMIEADWEARVLWIHNAIKYNPPESANVVISWGKWWDEIPECELKDKSYQTLKAFLEGYGEGFGQAFIKAFGEPRARTRALAGTRARSKTILPAAAPPVGSDQMRPARSKPESTNGNGEDHRTDHQKTIDKFCNLWKGKYKADFLFVGSQHGRTFKLFLEACKDYKTASQIITRYFQDEEQFVLTKKHPPSLMLSQIQKYVGAPAANSAESIINPPYMTEEEARKLYAAAGITSMEDLKP